MQLKDILAKIANGEGLTDEEKAFAGSFDLQATLDSAAGAARKKAEADAKIAKEALAKLQAEFDEFKDANDPAKGQTELQKLTARLERLETAKKAAEDRAAGLERTARVRTMTKEAGILAAKGVDPKTLDILVDNLLNGVDLDDADAVKAAFDGFKSANAGLIAAQTVSGIGTRGTPGASAYGGKNPFASESLNLTEQMRLLNDSPEQAKALAAEAGVNLE